MKWYIKVLKNYIIFKGRARRKEYWFFILFNIIFMFLALIIDIMFGTIKDPENPGIIFSIYSIAVILPSISVSVRRLHDIGKNGWYLLISLLPFGSIILIGEFIKKGISKENKYGIDPIKKKFNISVD